MRRQTRYLALFVASTALAGLLGLTGCLQPESKLEGMTGWSGSPRGAQPTPGAASLAEAIQVQDRHGADLMSVQGVVGTGSSVDANNEPVVVVFTENAGVAGIPKELDGVPVVVEVTGKVQALAASAAKPTVSNTAPAPVCASVNRAGEFARPVPIGVSTGHYKVTAGTIGVRVKNSAGALFLLSNNHVFANTNNAAAGDKILQPGPFDGGVNPDDAVATLKDWTPLVYCNGGSCPANKMDAAIASTTAALSGKATPCDGYGTPSITTLPPMANLKVKKYGRTTGLTSGVIAAVNVTIDVAYTATQVARFTGQVYIATPNFNGPGDSGSLIVAEAGNYPVALLFAGTSNATFATPIADVLKKFNVTIDGI